MLNFLGIIFKPLLGTLERFTGFLVAYYQGKKQAQLESAEAALENVRRAKQLKNRIRNLDDDTLSSILRGSTKKSKSSDKQ